MRYAFTSLVGSVLLTMGPVALGCSATPLPPRQLVAQAEAIYLVRADGYQSEPASGVRGAGGLIRFSVVKTLKGPKVDDLRITGRLTSRPDPNNVPIPYEFVRPDGRKGDCVATAYMTGQHYLVFLQMGTPYWAPLSPVNEQVSGVQDSWVLWAQQELRRR